MNAITGHVFIVALLVCGCSAPQTPAQKSVEADTTYAGEMAACVATSTTREASQACRADVRQRWGVDGGAL